MSRLHVNAVWNVTNNTLCKNFIAHYFTLISGFSRKRTTCQDGKLSVLINLDFSLEVLPNVCPS